MHGKNSHKDVMCKNYMALKKEKPKKEKKKKIINCFHRGFGHSNLLLNSKRKDMRIIKCRKVKFGAYQGSQSILFLLLDFW